MVYWSDQAYEDFAEIFDGLLSWVSDTGMRHMDYDHVVEYTDRLYAKFDSIDRLGTHFKARYKDHKQHGEYVYTYRKNRKTTWYAVYDRFGADCYITRIFSNYNTRR